MTLYMASGTKQPEPSRCSDLLFPVAQILSGNHSTLSSVHCTLKQQEIAKLMAGPSNSSQLEYVGF